MTGFLQVLMLDPEGVESDVMHPGSAPSNLCCRVGLKMADTVDKSSYKRADNLKLFTVTSVEELDEAKEMGRGCNGAVYEVRLHGLPCIAKRLHDILVGRGREEPVSREQRSVVIGRFREECVLLSGLRHGLAYTSTPSPSYIVTSMLATCCSLSLSEQRLLTSG